MSVVKDKSMIRTQVFLKHDQKKRLQQLSRKRNEKSSEIIRKALDAILDQYEKEDYWLDGFENFRGCLSSSRAEELSTDIQEARTALQSRNSF